MTIRILLFIFLSVIFSQLSFCQTNVIIGTIVSYETKQPMRFCEVELKGKIGYGVMTDNKGKFVFQNVSRSKNDYLKVSYFEYKSLKIINIPIKNVLNLDSIFIPSYVRGDCMSLFVMGKNGNKIFSFFYTKQYRIKRKKEIKKKNKKIAYNYRYSFENKKYRIIYKNNTINLRKPVKNE